MMVSVSSALSHISSLYYEQRDGVTLGSSFLGNSRFWSPGQKAGVVGTYLCCPSRLWLCLGRMAGGHRQKEGSGPMLSGWQDRQKEVEGLAPCCLGCSFTDERREETPAAQCFGSCTLLLWVAPGSPGVWGCERTGTRREGGLYSEH